MLRDVATWVALASALGLGVERLIAWRRTPSEVRHTDVESDNVVIGGYAKLLADVQAERKRMAEHLENLERRLSTAELKVFKLENWVRAQGHDPLHIYDDPTGYPV